MVRYFVPNVWITCKCLHAGSGSYLWHEAWVSREGVVLLCRSSEAIGGEVDVTREQGDAELALLCKLAELIEKQALLDNVARGRPMVQEIIEELWLPKLVHEMVHEACTLPLFPVSFFLPP